MSIIRSALMTSYLSRITVTRSIKDSHLLALFLMRTTIGLLMHVKALKYRRSARLGSKRAVK